MNLNKVAGTILKTTLLVGLFAGFFLVLLSSTFAINSGSSGNANLTIWDDTDLGENRFSDINITFFANFSNSTFHIINSTEGNCTIRFDHLGSYGSPFEMLFNTSRTLWLYTTLINYKGTYNFQVNCTSPYGNVTVTDSFTITNTAPKISKDQGNSYIDLDGNKFNNDYLQCVEDVLCVYNFSANVTEIDLNDILTFGYFQNTNTTLTNFTLNTTTGILLINYTNDADIGDGNKVIELTVRDTESSTQTGILRVNVTPENDPPYFLNLEEKIINKSGIELILMAKDEENDVPYRFNVTFLSCVHASLNPPTGPDNCTLFNLTYYNETAVNISFIPQPNQKGEYEINFTVIDSRNATFSTIKNWTVTWNDVPFFTYACNNERSAIEKTEFICYINATDTDELNNLTFTANYSWFTFNKTLSNTVVIPTSGGNASAMVNFTPTNTEVGNWSIKINVTDTGAPYTLAETNSTTFYFFIDNDEDPVLISNIPDITAYTSETYTIYVNATDNDLLVPDKTVKNESLTFFTNNTHVVVTNTLYITGTNKTQATLYFDPNNLGAGEHIINVTVHDRGNLSTDSTTFKITVNENTAPQWDVGMATEFNLTENLEFYLNLSQNVTDPDGDPISFSLTLMSPIYNPNPFDMTINPTTGVINFTPTDNDVGIWRVRITATDGKTPSSKEFNFTVNNVNDLPEFYAFYITNGTPNSIGASGSINVTEDVPAVFFLQIADSDLLIVQTSFYREDFTLNLNISGPNTTLFQFANWQQVGNSNISQFRASFTPRKSDVGRYNITINITDKANASLFLQYNLTVNETLHPPNITTPIGNVSLSMLYENFYFDVNATDLEDGSDGPDGNLTFRIENLTAGGNFLTINTSTGVINFTTNTSLAGKWQFRLVVNDTDGEEDSEYFNISIYDYPAIILPNSSHKFYMVENVSYVLNFTATHAVEDELNYTLIINGPVQNFQNSTFGYGNGSEFLWEYTPDFTMETTCTGPINLTLNVSNSKLSNSTSWLVEINHTNYPLTFLTDIPNQFGASPIILALSDYFFDLDAADSCINQTIGFSYTQITGSASGGEISVAITNWSGGNSPTAVFSAQSEGSANFTLKAFEYNFSLGLMSNISSNNFSISLIVEPPQTPAPLTASSSSTRLKIISLKIIVPDPVSAKQKDRLIIPLGLVNDGQLDLNGIYLEAAVAKDGFKRNDLLASFDQAYFDSLVQGERKNVTMIVDIETNSVGLFEVTINATVERPEYTDWAKFYIQIEEDRSVLEKIIFTEEFIIGNPQCAELLDLVNDAKNLFYEGRITEATAKSEQALMACSKAITQPPRPRIAERLGDKFIGYTAIASLVAFAMGFAYYAYKKASLNRQLKKDLGKI